MSHKLKNNKKKNLQKFTSNIWDKYYVSQQKGNWVGNEYPTEPLIRYISNLRKDPKNKIAYFNDAGKELNIKKNFKGNALEIGFGTIANLLFLKKKGFKCKGLEVSANSVKRAEKYIAKNDIKNIKTYFWENHKVLPFKTNSFDLIVGLQCIYYNLEFNVFLKEIKRVLKPGGKFFFSFFSNNHDYIKYTDIVDGNKNLVKWNNKHPNKRIRGSVLFQPKDKKHLKRIFKNFKDINIFTYEFDQLPLFQSWWYINGINSKKK